MAAILALLKEERKTESPKIGHCPWHAVHTEINFITGML
jgi:hypothetical protein